MLSNRCKTVDLVKKMVERKIDEKKAHLVETLQDRNTYPHETKKTINTKETNVSWVFLTGDYAYKMKKAIRFGDVLDYSTLSKRKQACEDELTLNKRLAPKMYLNVVPLTEDGKINGDGEIIEYLVKMKEYPQEQLLSNIVEEKGKLSNEVIIKIAKEIAHFHQENVAFPKFDYHDTIYEKWDENFRTTKEYASFPYNKDLAGRVYDFIKRNKDFWGTRVDHKRIVDGHGDLQLKNIFLHDDNSITIFDCIEFNKMLRIQDVLEEIAFLAMDLEFNNLHDLSTLFVRTYCDEIDMQMKLSNPLLSFYKCYRAYVRAKVHYSAYMQSTDEDDSSKNLTLARKYLSLAEQYQF